MSDWQEAEKREGKKFMQQLVDENIALRAENARLLKLYDGGVAHWKDVLDKMEAENLRLREALKPFADAKIDSFFQNPFVIKELTDYLRAARAAMGETE